MGFSIWNDWKWIWMYEWMIEWIRHLDNVAEKRDCIWNIIDWYWRRTRERAHVDVPITNLLPLHPGKFTQLWSRHAHTIKAISVWFADKSTEEGKSRRIKASGLFISQVIGCAFAAKIRHPNNSGNGRHRGGSSTARVCNFTQLFSRNGSEYDHPETMKLTASFCKAHQSGCDAGARRTLERCVSFCLLLNYFSALHYKSIRLYISFNVITTKKVEF